jgi:hypothetical protein
VELVYAIERNAEYQLLSDADLDKFIESFPKEMAKGRGSSSPSSSWTSGSAFANRLNTER